MKSVQYIKLKVKGKKSLYNLGFGDLNKESGDLDDHIISNNQDRDKVLATVAHTVVLFTKRRPKAQIFFEGSNKARTRLYQMAINKYFDELSKTFIFEGFIEDYGWLPYDKNTKYDAFLITRKIN